MKPLTTASLLAAAVCISSALWAQAPSPNYPQQNYPPQNYPQPGYPPNYGAQPNSNQPPSYDPQELDELVAPYALYPDPLLAQVLTAASFSYQIPDADGWARAHAYLSGDALARAINDDNLPWDPSVIALLPTPSVLDTMAGDMARTQDLGNAVLADRSAVMDAIQDQRQKAYNYGYLRTNQQIRVATRAPGDIEIQPVNPQVVYVPYYDPNIVYFRPRPGFYVAGAINFGPGIYINSFLPWGWGGVSFGWRNHTIIVNNRPWERTWVNRGNYVHPYNLPARPRAAAPAPRMERHELRDYRPAQRPAERGPAQRGPAERGGGDRGGDRSRDRR